MVHQGLPHLERMRHAGPIHLGVDIADQIGLEIEVLDEGQSVVGVGPPGMLTEHVDGAVAGEAALESGREQLLAHVVAEDRDAVEVAVHRVARQRLEGRLAAQKARRTIGLGVQAPERAEQRLAQAQRQRGAHALLAHVQTVAPISAEALVPTITGEGHRDVLSRKLANAVRRDGRAISIRLVVDAGERIDQAEVIACDLLDEVPGLVPVRDHLRKLGLVERKHGHGMSLPLVYTNRRIIWRGQKFYL